MKGIVLAGGSGTHDTLADASIFIETLEKRTGCKIACLEEIAYEQGWISAEKLKELAKPMIKNQYGEYLMRLAEEKLLTDKVMGVYEEQIVPIEFASI